MEKECCLAGPGAAHDAGKVAKWYALFGDRPTCVRWDIVGHGGYVDILKLDYFHVTYTLW